VVHVALLDATARLAPAASRSASSNRIRSCAKHPLEIPINTMEEEQAAHHLLNVLEERGLDVDLDKILLGFESEQTRQDAAAWVEEYLHENTLLSKEELELYVLYEL
jgi:hypothetical protein